MLQRLGKTWKRPRSNNIEGCCCNAPGPRSASWRLCFETLEDSPSAWGGGLQEWSSTWEMRDNSPWHLNIYHQIISHRWELRRLTSQRPRSFCRPFSSRGRSQPCEMKCFNMPFISISLQCTDCQLCEVNNTNSPICTFLRLVTTSLVGGSEQGLPLFALNIGGSAGLSATIASSVDLIFLLLLPTSLSLKPPLSLPSLHR